MKTLLGILIVLAGLGAAYWYFNGAQQAATSMGAYAYACNNGSGFTMTPAADVRTVQIVGGAQDMFTGTATLSAQGNNRFAGAHMGEQITFVGAGEEVQLTVGSESAVCNPVASSDMAPWNWGDAGEGAGAQQDIGAAVKTNVVGKWMSTEDEGFTREFKVDGSVVDAYSGGESSGGTWQVFTKTNPINVSFPLEENTAYLQLNVQGLTGILNFKVVKLTPEDLELVYMDRGGFLTFKAIQ